MTTAFRAFAFTVFFLAMGTAPVLANSGKEAKKDGPLYVDVKNIVVPVIKQNGKSGVVAFSVMAQVKDDSAKANVTDQLPRLRDAFIRTLYGNLEKKEFTREDGNLNVDQIKDRLLKTAAFVMKDKENPITDILFQNIAQQSY